MRNIALMVGVLALCSLAIYGLWRPEVRIAKVIASSDQVASVAQAKLSGTYYHVFPRDSFFFYPEAEVRQAVMDEYPEVSSVAISREGFDAIEVKVTERRSALLWCGTPEEAPQVSHECYEADADGMLFRSAPESASTTAPELRFYAHLDTASSTDSYPLRAKVLGVSSMRDILRFADDIAALSVPVRAVGIRGDEADLYTPEGTRVTYVIGKEKEARESARAAFPKLNLVDGSVEYVDLRFPGKVYVKRVGE